MLKKITITFLLGLLFISVSAQDSFIKVLQSGDKYKFEIPDLLLGESILFGSRIVDLSSPSAKVFSAGQMRKPPVLVRFSKRENLIVIEEINTFVDVDSNDPISAPLASNMIVGAVNYFDIELRNSSNNASIIDVTKYFSDEVQLAWPLPDNVKKGRLDSKLSKILFVKEHDDRVNIRSYYEFLGGKETFAITVQYFLLKLPTEPLLTRFNDERVGYQPFNKKSFASGKAITTNRYISRWRVEPSPADMAKHANGELVEPQSQIVMYIEPYFPSDWIPFIKQGVEAWNVAFEKIGFKNVLVAKEFPENDLTFDPFDIKTNVIRYIPIDEANAAGQIWTDPRSGEIINGEVLWWNNVVNLISMWRFTQTAAVDPLARSLNYSSDYLGEMVSYAIAHEVGHALGIQHNLRSSYAYPIDSLRSPSFTQEYGTTASIMDYARFNHVAQPGDLERGVSLTPPGLGPFDLLSIEYGYKYIHSAKLPDDELPVLDSLFKSKGDNPMYRFSPFIAVPISPDPAAQTESLGDDVIRSSTKGIMNTQIILDSLIIWTFNEGGSVSDINSRYDALSKQYFRYINLSMSYIGGVYSLYGPLDSTATRHIPVVKAKQQDALAFVIKSLREVPHYLDHSRFSPIIGSKTENVLKRQSEIVESLLGNFILPRVVNSSSFGSNQYSLEDYLFDVDKLVWKSFNSNSIYDKNLQITYLQTLSKLSKVPQEANSSELGIKAIVAEAAFAQLLKTKRYLEKMKRRDSKSKNHYMFLLDLI